MNKVELTEAVKSAQNGDSKAIELLFKEFNQQIYYSALLIVKNEETAKDITQETFITVINKIGELQKPESFPSWVKKIAQSKCSDFYKRKEIIHETTVSTDDEDDVDVFGNIEEDDSEFIPDKALDKEDLKRIIFDILNELPDVQRAAIVMRYYEDMSVKEIAEIQGVTEGTVMSRLNYGRKAIAKAVEDYEEENNIKLHAIPFIPFFHWAINAAKNQSSAKVMGEIASGVSKATGVSLGSSSVAGTAAVTGGIAAKIASAPLIAKVAVPIVVAAVAVTPVVVKNVNDSATEPTTVITTEFTTEVPVAEIITTTTTTEITTQTDYTEKSNETTQKAEPTKPTTVLNENYATTEKPIVTTKVEEPVSEEIYDEPEDVEPVEETEDSGELEIDGTTAVY